jgi:DNA-binding protein
MTEPKRRKRTEKKEKPAKSAKPAGPATSATPTEPTAATQKTEGNEKIVFVGNKPVENYVIACLTSFTAGSNKIVIKARGRAICRAVDTVELLRRAFLKDAQLQGISICTEQVTREGDRKANVSAIEITLTKP